VALKRTISITGMYAVIADKSYLLTWCVTIGDNFHHLWTLTC